MNKLQKAGEISPAYSRALASTAQRYKTSGGNF